MASEDSPFQQQLTSTLLKLCLLEAARYKTCAAPEQPLVRQVRAYIQENYTQLKDNTAIAQAFGYHSYYLNRLFKQNTGMTLHQYLTALRIKKSKELLGETALSVSEIAEACGFGSADQFTWTFKAQVSTTPTAYRKQVRRIGADQPDGNMI